MTALRQVKNTGALIGKRKSHAPRPSIPLRWPREKKERLALFDAWHDVAMQIVHLENDDFRLLAAVRKVLMFASGEIVASNREIAWRAGHCSDKTVTRCIRRYVDLGIFVVSSGWRRDGDNLFKTRTIRLSLPKTMDDRVELADLEPFGRDTRGPGLEDTRGPISRVTRKECHEEVGVNGTVELFSEPEEGR